MSNKATAIVASVSLIVLFGGGIAFAVIKSGSKPKVFAPIPQTVANTGATTQDSSGITLGADTNQSGIGLQSNLDQTNSTGSEKATSVPGPETFAQYDQYKDNQSALFADLKVGTGTEVAVGSTAAVTYKGWFTNGQLFDQSPTTEDGKIQAFKFTVGEHRVIAGWEQDVVGMKVGGSRRFIVPPVAGYGSEGKDPVPPNAVLIFDVNLVGAL